MTKPEHTNAVARARYDQRSPGQKRAVGRWNPRGPYGVRPSRILHALPPLAGTLTDERRGRGAGS